MWASPLNYLNLIVDGYSFCEILGVSKLLEVSKRKDDSYIILQIVLNKLQVELAICDNSKNAKGIDYSTHRQSERQKRRQNDMKNIRVRSNPIGLFINHCMQLFAFSIRTHGLWLAFHLSPTPPLFLALRFPSSFFCCWWPALNCSTQK